MKKKKIFRSISKILSVLIVFSMLCPVMNVFASSNNGEKYSVKFKLNRLEGQKSEHSSERFFYYWYLGNTEMSEAEKLEASKKYSKMTISEIDEATKKTTKTHGSTKASKKVSDDYEIIEISGLAEGTWLFVEPEDSFKDQKTKIVPQVVTLPKQNGETIDVKKTTTVPTNETKLIKVDEDGNRLSGVEFEFYKSNQSGDVIPVSINGNNGIFKYSKDKTNYVARIKTNSYGEIIIADLPELGSGEKYVFKEYSTLSGYVLDITEKEAKRNDSITVVNKKNPDNGGYNFIKVDSNNDTVRLQGARFKVMKRADDGRLSDVIKDGRVYTVTSDSKGNFKVEGLPFGNYTLMEVYAPEGYRLSTQAHNFTVSGNSGISQALIIENKRETEKPPTPPHENPPPNPPSENPPTPPHANPPGPPNENPPGPPNENPPSPPNENPPRTRGPLPKTGDTAIYFAVAFGLVLVFKGTKMVKFN